MEKLLVLGADRSIGAHLAECLADRFAAVSLVEGTEIASPAALRDSVLREAPDWTVYCGACSAASWDEVSPTQLAGEAQRAAAVAQAVEVVGGRLTVVSSDAVFDGPRLYHAEESPTVGGQPLAEAALAVEAAVEASGALVVRTHAFGLSPHASRQSFAERVVAALLNGEPVPADGRRYASPLHAGDLAEILFAAYEAGLRGVYHVAGAERVNQRRFTAELAAVLGVEWSLAEVPRMHTQGAARLETSLICQRAQRALSQPMPWLRDSLQAFAEECHDLLRANRDVPATLRAVAA